MKIDKIDRKSSVYTPIMAELIEKAELSKYTGRDKEIFLFGLMQGYEACLKKLELIQVNYSVSKYAVSKIPDCEEYVKHNLIRSIGHHIENLTDWEKLTSPFDLNITFTGRILVMPNNKKEHE